MNKKLLASMCALVLANAAHGATLYSQTDYQGAYGISSQTFGERYSSYDNAAADDFVVTGVDADRKLTHLEG